MSDTKLTGHQIQFAFCVSLRYSFGYSPPPKGNVSFQQSKDSDVSGDDKEKEDDKAASSDEEKGKESDGDEDSDGDDDEEDDEEDDDDLESDEEEDEEEVEKMVESLLKKKMEEKKGGPRSILKKSKAAADPEVIPFHQLHSLPFEPCSCCTLSWTKWL